MNHTTTATVTATATTTATTASPQPFIFLPSHLANKYTFDVRQFIGTSGSIGDDGADRRQGHRLHQAQQFVVEFCAHHDGRPGISEHALLSLQSELVDFWQLLKEETISLVDKDFNRFIDFSAQLQAMRGRMGHLRQLMATIAAPVEAETPEGIDSNGSGSDGDDSAPSLTGDTARIMKSVQTLVEKCTALLESRQRCVQREMRAREWIQVHQMIGNWRRDRDDLYERLHVESSDRSHRTGTRIRFEYGSGGIHELLRECSSLSLELHRITLIMDRYGGLLEADLSQQQHDQSHRERQHYMVVEQLRDKCKQRHGELQEQFLVLLEQLLMDSYCHEDADDSDALRDNFCQVLKLFTLCEQQQRVEEFMRDRIFGPLLTGHLKTSHYQEENVSPARFYDALIESLRQRCVRERFFLQHCTQLGFHFLERSLWPPLCDTLVGQKQWKLFEFRARKVFHENYTISMAMFDRLTHVCCVDQEHENRFRRDYISKLERRWQLKIYFTLVKQELIKDFENCLLDNSSTATTLIACTDDCFHLQITATLWHMLRQMHDPREMYIGKLSKEFTQLTLQALLRCSEWLQTRIEELLSDDPNDQASLSTLSQLYQDMSTLQSMLTGDRLHDNQHHESLYSAMIRNLERSPETLRSLLSQWSSEFLAPILTQLLNGICAILERQCVDKLQEGLKSVTSVTKQFKAFSKHASSEHALYITETLHLISEFLKTVHDRSKDTTIDGYDEIAATCKDRVVHAIAKAFVSRARDGIDNARKIEERLKNLQKYKKAANGTDDSASNADRIRDQLRVDFETLLDMAERDFHVSLDKTMYKNM